MKVCAVLLLAFCGHARAQQSTSDAGPSLVEFLAQERAARTSARVRVFVEADVDLKFEVQSYFGRELRALGDVQTVDDHQDYDVLILAQWMLSRAGELRGVAISFVAATVPAARSRTAAPDTSRSSICDQAQGTVSANFVTSS